MGLTLINGFMSIGDDNPADDASSGLTADVFVRQSRWLTGSAFLWKHDSMWPTQDELFGEVANDDPEVRREEKFEPACNP